MPTFLEWTLDNSEQITESLLLNPANHWDELGLHVLLLVRVASPNKVFTERAKRAIEETIFASDRESLIVLDYIFQDDYALLQGLEQSRRYSEEQAVAYASLLMTTYRRGIRPSDERIVKKYGARVQKFQENPRN